MHLVRPHHGSLLPSTVHNALALVNIIHVHTDGCALSISVKPGSATDFPTSTASAGLQYLLVGAHVHLVWFRAASRHVWLLHLCCPAFLWNVGMVLHVLKSDPTLRDLEHVQVDGPRMAYLSFLTNRAVKDSHLRPLML